MTFEMIALLTISAVLVLGLLVAGIFARSRRGPATSTVDPTGELTTLLANRDGVMSEKVAQLDSKLAELQQSLTSRESALNTQVADMGLQMKSIAGLFTNDRTRGSWGEISMVRIFERAGMIEGLDYDTQITIKGRTPDAIVHIPGGCEVVIDSKFPLARYLDALDTEDPEQRRQY
ncbi:MAG TPA: DNA recombination protein RmuC, partial [Acidimicrobiia bacterium]